MAPFPKKISVINIFLAWIPACVLMTCIFIMSHRPHVQASTDEWYNFAILKTLHACGYALLWLSYRFALARTFPSTSSKQISLIAVVFAFLYATLDELHQQYIPTRTGTLRDIGIDLLGVASIYWLHSYGFFRKVQKLVALHAHSRTS
jgi:VanZ family protein